MEEHCIYLYAVIRSGAELGALEGIEPGFLVERLDCNGVDAVVSRLPGTGYFAPHDTPADPNWIIPRVLRHDRVVGTLYSRAAVLPVRFATVFSSPLVLAESISRHRTAIDRFLTSVDGKDEWSLRAHFNTERATELILRTDRELSARWDSLPLPLGARYFSESRLRSDAVIRARRLLPSSASIVRETVLKGTRAVELPIAPGGRPDRPLILSAALLLPRESADQMITAIRENITTEQPCVELEVTGPWAPFSFCPDISESVSL